MDKSKQLSKAKYEDWLLQLIKRAEMFLSWSDELYRLYDSMKPNPTQWRQEQDFFKNRGTRYLVLHQVLYFFETALLLHTLLKQGKKDRELSFENYFSTTNSSNFKFKQQIEEVREMYVNSKIGIVRHKIIAHKDIKHIGDPGFHFINWIDKDFICKADEIIKKLREITSENFNDLAMSNEIKGFYDDAHNCAMEAIRKEIKRGVRQSLAIGTEPRIKIVLREDSRT